VATALGVEVRGGSVTAEVDLDFRGTLAIDKDVPVGFRRSASGSTSTSTPTPAKETSPRCSV
jgi:hypothetical protein